MRRVGYALGGAVLGAAVAIALAVAIAVIADVSQAEGAYAMGVAFFWAPLGAVLGLLGGILMGRSRRG